LTWEVADCPQSAIVEEVRNGVPVRMAILAGRWAEPDEDNNFNSAIYADQHGLKHHDLTEKSSASSMLSTMSSARIPGISLRASLFRRSAEGGIFFNARCGAGVLHGKDW
jgi:hypothetical protein